MALWVLGLVLGGLLAAAGAHAQSSADAGMEKVFRCQGERGEFSGTNLTETAAKCTSRPSEFGWGNVSYGVRNCNPNPNPATCEMTQNTVYCNGQWGPGRVCGTEPDTITIGTMQLPWDLQPGCEQLKVVASGYFDIGTKSTASPVLLGCKGGCEVVFDGSSPAASTVENGVKTWYAKGSYANTGKRCTAGTEGRAIPEGKEKPSPGTCAEGQGVITMNGRTVCVDQNDKPTPETDGKEKTVTEKKTEDNPDGSKTTTETTTKTRADGSQETVTTRTTVRPDGSSTTVTEKVGGDAPGGDSGTDDGTEEKGRCEKNPSDAGCGGSPAAVDGLYAAKDKTFAGVMAARRAEFEASPLGQGVAGFFTVSSAAACPRWSATLPYLNTEMVFDHLCTTWAGSALVLLKAVFLTVCGWFAFRVVME